MKNSQQHLGNEANVTLRKNINLVPRLLSHTIFLVIFLMVSPLLGRFLVSFNLQSANLWSAVYSLQSAVCGLQSAVCDLQSANVIHRVDTGAIAFETAKNRLHYRRYRKQTTRSRSPIFFLIYGYTTLDVLAISQFRIIHSF